MMVLFFIPTKKKDPNQTTKMLQIMPLQVSCDVVSGVSHVREKKPGSVLDVATRGAQSLNCSVLAES
jgi:hypothetical protein